MAKEGGNLAVRLVAVVSLAVVLAVLVFQVMGIGELDPAVDGYSLLLVALAIVLSFVVVAPKSVKEVLDRITRLKVGAFGVGLQAATRVELLEAQDSDMVDGFNARDDVESQFERPVGGGRLWEYERVRDKLEEKLRFIRETLLDSNSELSALQVVERIDSLKLVEDNEVRVLYDLLGRVEDSIERLPSETSLAYLEAAWRFSTRFATLVFERQVRRGLSMTAGSFSISSRPARIVPTSSHTSTRRVGSPGRGPGIWSQRGSK